MIGNSETLEQKLHLMKMSLASLIGIREGMRVLDVGCGQGMFTACVAKLVGKTGEVVAVDITDEYLNEMNQNLDKYRVRHLVRFVKGDAVNLSSLLTPESFDVVTSYRLIEELTQPSKLPKIVAEIARLVRQDGRVAMIELSTETKNVAEENLVRLHRDIGDDYFPTKREILRHMKNAGLKGIRVETVETKIWYSPALFLKGAGGQDEIWSELKGRIMQELWPSVKQHGMKYPPINIFIGQKTRVKD